MTKWKGEEFPKTRNSHFPLTPNPKDFESNSDDWHDDKFLVDREPQLPLSPNPKDY